MVSASRVPYTTLFRSLFEQRLAHRLHDATVHLAVHQQRIQHVAAVVHGHIFLELDVAGFAIHFHHADMRSEEHTSELQSLRHLVCRLLLEKKTKYTST